MRIGGPARSTALPTRTSGTPSDTAMRRVVMAEDLTMRIGPASDGALLEIGGLDIEGADPVVIHAMALRPTFYRFLG